jgi:hypothetical protein
VNTSELLPYEDKSPNARRALGDLSSYGNSSDVFTSFDGSLSKAIISEQMKEVERVLKLPTSEFDYAALRA